MGDEQFAEWMEFYGINPWDGHRLDVVGAIVAATVAEPNRNRKTHPDPFTLGEFMHKWDDDDGEARTAKSADELDEAAGQTIAVLRALRRGNPGNSPDAGTGGNADGNIRRADGAENLS